MWLFTVVSLTTSRPAISMLDSPWAISASTSASRCVSPAGSRGVAAVDGPALLAGAPHAARIWPHGGKVLGSGRKPGAPEAEEDALARRETALVTAARCVGDTDARVMFRHVLPNSVTALSVVATQQVAAMILAEAALSYLGLGVPSPTW